MGEVPVNMLMLQRVLEGNYESGSRRKSEVQQQSWRRCSDVLIGRENDPKPLEQLLRR